MKKQRTRQSKSRQPKPKFARKFHHLVVYAEQISGVDLSGESQPILSAMLHSFFVRAAALRARQSVEEWTEQQYELNYDLDLHTYRDELDDALSNAIREVFGDGERAL
jgi:hypothetical protein